MRRSGRGLIGAPARQQRFALAQIAAQQRIDHGRGARLTQQRAPHRRPRTRWRRPDCANTPAGAGRPPAARAARGASGLPCSSRTASGSSRRYQRTLPSVTARTLARSAGLTGDLLERIVSRAAVHGDRAQRAGRRGEHAAAARTACSTEARAGERLAANEFGRRQRAPPLELQSRHRQHALAALHISRPPVRRSRSPGAGTGSAAPPAVPSARHRRHAPPTARSRWPSHSRLGDRPGIEGAHLPRDLPRRSGASRSAPRALSILRA